MAKDYYDILGIKKGASDEEIKRAYRRLAHQYHPDKAGGNEAKFKEINEAYQVLGDAQKRQQYERFGSNFENMQGAGGFGGAQDFSSFGDAFEFFRQGQGARGNAQSGFEEFDLGDLFGGIFGGGARTRQTAPKGADIAVDVEMTLEDVLRGLKRDLSVKKGVKCSECNGTGALKGTNLKNCEKCKGQGRIQETRGSGFFSFSQVKVCPDCGGVGKKPEKKCTECAGSGVKSETVKLKVEIPAGIEDGQMIRLTGQGEAGRHGTASGDLYVRIHVLPHKHFKRHGFNLIYDLDISFTQAALGDKIEMPTLEDKINLEIPEGVQSGATIRVAGKGLSNGRNRGDIFVNVIVRTPKKLSKKAKQLLSELKEEL